MVYGRRQFGLKREERAKCYKQSEVAGTREWTISPGKYHGHEGVLGVSLEDDSLLLVAPRCASDRAHFCKQIKWNDR